MNPKPKNYDFILAIVHDTITLDEKKKIIEAAMEVVK